MIFVLTTVAAAADRFVLVRDGAVLQAGQDRITLQTADHAPLAMQLLDEEGNVFTVRPLFERDKGHCSSVTLQPDANLNLKVGRADVESVLTKSYTQSWKDGTSIRFSAGAWMNLQRDGTWKASVEGVSVVVKVPIGEIGTSYEVDAAFPAWHATSSMLRMGASIRTGGGTVNHRGDVTDAVLSDDTTATGSRVEVVGRCLDIVGDVATVDLLGTVAAKGGIHSDDGATMEAPSGTALVWLDGHVAGELAADTKFKKVSGVRDRVCLELKLAESTFQACMNEDAATAIKR